MCCSNLRESGANIALRKYIALVPCIVTKMQPYSVGATLTLFQLCTLI